MSLFYPVNLVCPSCQGLVIMEAVGSVNADRRPDYREAILEDRFQDTTCGSCGHTFRLQPEFTYFDGQRRQWIAALPAARVTDWAAAEAEATEVFATSHGARAPAAAREVGASLDVRVTFGWPALREKLLARQAGLDDVSLECLKLDAMRTVPSAPVGIGIDLRLVVLNDTDMGFAWLRSRGEAAVKRVLIPRAAYDFVHAAQDDWAEVRAQLTAGPFVDMLKFTLRDGRPQEVAAETLAP